MHSARCCQPEIRSRSPFELKNNFCVACITTGTILTLQKATGLDKGSWDPATCRVSTDRRVLATGLAILSLEVYYRLLPMYGFFGHD